MVGVKPVIVSRTAYRNNKSIYHVNGVVSNFTEIANLLRGYGVDLDHKRFLILQGEVEAIAMMKPKAATEHEEGLLEYLEDIIGTNKYIDPIEVAAKEVDSTNELYSERFIRVKAAERECHNLKGEKEQAEDYLRKENSLIERRSELCQVNIWQAQKTLAKSREQITRDRAQLKAERAKNASNSQLVDELEGNLSAAGRNLKVSFCFCGLSWFFV